MKKAVLLFLTVAILASCEKSNVPEDVWVDLGLSVKWAKCNLGATSPEDSGGYYAWGETEEKEEYSYETYEFYWDYEIEGNSICGTRHDAASVKWGDGARMPSYDDMEELVSKCTFKEDSYNNVSGISVTGPNGNSIFLPKAGYHTLTGFKPKLFHYLSGTCNSLESVALLSGGGHVMNVNFWSEEMKYYGIPIRPVKD